MLEKLKALALGQPLPDDQLSDHPSEEDPIDISDKLPDIDEALSLRAENEDLKKELELQKQENLRGRGLESKTHMLEDTIRCKDIDIHYLEDELEKHKKMAPVGSPEPMAPTPNYKTINIASTWSSEQVGFLIKHLLKE